MGVSIRPSSPGVVRVTRRRIERASATDRAFVAMEVGDVPEQLGVVLELDGHLTLSRVRELVADRIGAVPRLRQRLVSTPLGCGGPVWVDDAGFDLGRHVREVSCRAPGGERELVETALTTVLSPLSRERPMWSMVLLTGLEDDRSALVVVLHHALADGIGGLNVLAQLVDPGSDVGDADFPQRPPAVASLLVDALVRRVKALLGVDGSWRLLRSSMSAGGGLRPPRIARCSLMRPTGTNRRIIVVRTRYDDLRTAAHRLGATTNDAVLVAVSGALGQVLAARGEHVDTLVITVPVSGRRPDSHELGNLVSPLLVPVPTRGHVGHRLAGVAATVRAGKAGASGPPPIAVLGWVFRPLARLGGFRWYMNHQRRFHTLVSHLRGPEEVLSFGGVRISAAVPIAVGQGGNATVYFEVLSYSGTLTISAIVDPDHFPDADALAAALSEELRLISSLHDPALALPSGSREVSQADPVTPSHRTRT
jgi:WS/DGAT/MGAT family acyltransferase